MSEANHRPERESPFSVLGIPPTLDAAAVKHAYFTAIQRCPPHREPDAFKRIRCAYEELGRPGALAAAYLTAPVELALEARRLQDRWQPLLDEAAREADAERKRRRIVAGFVATISARSHADATSR